MQVAPPYDDVVVARSPRSSRSASRSPSAQGSPRSSSASIPGIGFGKTPDQNLELVRRLDRIVAHRPAGARRALAQVARSARVARRSRRAQVGTDAASVGAAVAAFDRGATIFRVHDVRSHVEALAGGGRRGAGKRDGVTIELQRDRAPRLPRRARGRARERAAVPRRRRARPRRQTRGDDRPTSRTRSTTATSSRPSSAGLRRARLPPPRGARDRARRRPARAASR